MGDYTNAAQLIEFARDYFFALSGRKEIEDRWLSHCYRYLAFLNAFRRDIPLAKKNLRLYEGINKRLVRKTNIPHEKWCEGIIAWLEGNTPEAIELIAQAINESEAESYIAYKAEMLAWKGLALRYQGTKGEALECFRQAIQCGPKDSNAKAVALAHFYLAQMLMEQKDEDSRRDGQKFLHIACNLKANLGFVDYPEIEKECREIDRRSSIDVVSHAMKETKKLLAPLGWLS